LAAGHDEFDSPVDLPRDEPGRRPLGWTTLTLFVASLFLLVTNAFSIKGWIDEQPASPLQAKLAAWAGEWEDATGSLGLGTPRAEIHRVWKESEAARFVAPPSTDQR
jgi:hypothetical protein